MLAVDTVTDFPYCTLRDTDSFRIVFSIETFLRRMLRWETHGVFGKNWKDGVPDEVKTQIRIRQDREREVVVIDHYQHSPFSFLLTTELEAVICGAPLWEKVFAKFLPPLGLVSAEFHRFVAIRNKVVHFRPLTSDDYQTLVNIRQNFLKWASRYRDLAREIAYVGGFLEDLDLANNPEDEERIQKQLAKRNLTQIWELFQSDLQDKSVEGISVGLGTVHHHLFFQFRIDGVLPGEKLLPLFDKWEDTLTFVNVGQLRDFMRLFIPFTEGQSCQEIVNDVCRVIQGSVVSEQANPDERLLEIFGVGRREGILSDGKPTLVGFIF
jgi:hypothetical protein